MTTASRYPTTEINDRETKFEIAKFNPLGNERPMLVKKSVKGKNNKQEKSIATICI